MKNKQKNEILEFKKELKRAKAVRFRLVLAPAERAFVRWHFGGDLLKLPEYNSIHGWPYGVYEIYDVKTETDYLYFDQEEVRYSDIRFELGKYNMIEGCVNIKANEPDRENCKIYEVIRGINGALMFNREEKNESN